jgi:methylmalonyl-CoA mutase C-terminal domain/subunit
MEVIYTGLWQTPEAVVRAVEDEDADVLGVSILSGAHMTLIPQLVERLRNAGLAHVQLIVGGIIPERDIPALEASGVAHVFTPGAPLTDITDFVRSAVAAQNPT